MIINFLDNNKTTSGNEIILHFDSTISFKEFTVLQAGLGAEQCFVLIAKQNKE